jgi:hypothetical protein
MQNTKLAQLNCIVFTAENIISNKNILLLHPVLKMWVINVSPHSEQNL